MQQRRGKTGGRHRAPRRSPRARATVGAVSVAGAAVAGAALLGVTPTLTTSPQLLATLHYLRGTNIGGVPSEQQFQDFIGTVLDGTGTAQPDEPYEKVPYNAGFWPFSHGGFNDLTFNESVAQGVNMLAAENPGPGDMIFGYSQGAVAASIYKDDHVGNIYVLVENPGRPNGGIMQRFKGVTIPFIDVTFNGATPNNLDPTIDVARQYDGWADFPTYLWNPLAVANAFMGILLVHSTAQTDLTVADLQEAEAAGSDYYQFHPGSNTKYYLIKTYPIPLLMPLDPILPDSVIAALDAPLRAFIELAYDRSDYSKPTRAWFFPPLKSLVKTAEADIQTVAPTVGEETAEQDSPDEAELQSALRQVQRSSAEEPGPELADTGEQAGAADDADGGQDTTGGTDPDLTEDGTSPESAVQQDDDDAADDDDTPDGSDVGDDSDDVDSGDRGEESDAANDGGTPGNTAGDTGHDDGGSGGTGGDADTGNDGGGSGDSGAE
ncbi:PE-PPE domain-containing protein [Mycolicibacterium sp.]|uniref:PE-PPE domain-containing protein n=1 Tax=Mycolicibacterium sp. TaxID=2320850 RepID=UPI003D125EF3